MSAKNNLPPDVFESLAGLFLWWYGNHKEIRSVLRGKDTNDDELKNLSSRAVEEAWRNRWFAKGSLTKSVDSFIANNFVWLVDEPMLQHYTPRLLWEQLALIILFDQVTRNVFRGTSKAYDGDRKALQIACTLIRRKLPFHFRATIAICLCHSESMDMQLLLKPYVPQNPSNVLEKALVDISKQHMERIEEFGRLPERNTILKRRDTNREQAYLLQL